MAAVRNIQGSTWKVPSLHILFHHRMLYFLFFGFGCVLTIISSYSQPILAKVKHEEGGIWMVIVVLCSVPSVFILFYQFILTAICEDPPGIYPHMTNTVWGISASSGGGGQFTFTCDAILDLEAPYSCPGLSMTEVMFTCFVNENHYIGQYLEPTCKINQPCVSDLALLVQYENSFMVTRLWCQWGAPTSMPTSGPTLIFQIICRQ